MVRITQEDQPIKTPITLDEQSTALFRLLGMVIADQPEQLAHLLKRYGTTLSSSPSSSELIDATIVTMGKKDNAFDYDLSKLFAEQVIPEDYDSYRPTALIKPPPPRNTAVKTSPEQLIAGSMHEIFKKGLATRHPKAFQQKGKKETLESLRQYQQHKKAREAIAKVNKEEKPIDQEPSNQLVIVGIMGAMALTALFTGIVIYQIKKNKPIPMVVTA